MDNKELLKILDQRFEKIDKRLDKMDDRFDKIDQRLDKMDDKFGKIDQRFQQFDDKMNKGFKEVNDKMNKGFREINNKMENGFAEVNNKLDVLANSNMAQILISQTQSTKEINEKLDKYIAKNEIEHKKFDYEIADTKMKLKFAR